MGALKGCLTVGRTYDARAWQSRVVAVAVLAAVSLSCSPDLHEAAGPIIPIPNVIGTVLRADIPAFDKKVKLIDAQTDSTIGEDRTDENGQYAFAEVASGEWTIKASSQDPADYATVTYDFTKSANDDRLEVPHLALATDSLSALTPSAGDTIAVPSLAAPLTFTWHPPATAGIDVQVRVYNEGGDAVWYGSKSTTGSVRWNGIANQGSAIGRPIGGGPYEWRLRVNSMGGAIQSTTEGRRVFFTERGRP